MKQSLADCPKLSAERQIRRPSATVNSTSSALSEPTLASFFGFPV
jgi:hypothetical protein